MRTSRTGADHRCDCSNICSSDHLDVENTNELSRCDTSHLPSTGFSSRGSREKQRAFTERQLHAPSQQAHPAEQSLQRRRQARARASCRRAARPHAATARGARARVRVHCAASCAQRVVIAMAEAESRGELARTVAANASQPQMKKRRMQRTRRMKREAGRQLAGRAVRGSCAETARSSCPLHSPSPARNSDNN